MNQVLTRKEAKAQGKSKYFTGKPCKHGHVAERNTLSGQCVPCLKKQSKDWADRNPERVKEKHNKHRAKNKDKYNAWRKEYLRNRYKNDPYFKARVSMRTFLRRIKAAAQSENLSSNKIKDLGYTPEDFKNHIESLWKEGMSWENHGEWHIDHIKPVKAFLDEGLTDPSVVNSLDNLRPIWAEENLAKGSKFEFEHSSHWAAS
jgi:hypothetical protein